MKTERQVSAGGLVVRGESVLLISTREGRHWQLPKGHIEGGESRREAAEREVREETGVHGRVVAPLPEVEYWFVERGTQRIHKRVHYYLMSYEGGDPSGFDPAEVSGAAFFPWEGALARLTFANERKVLQAALELVRGTGIPAAGAAAVPAAPG